MEWPLEFVQVGLAIRKHGQVGGDRERTEYPGSSCTVMGL
jgi:hypothetical protein